MLFGGRPILCCLTQFHADGKGATLEGLAISDARARIQVPLDRSDGKVLVRLPRVFGQDAGPVRTDINGVGEFVGGILEAVGFHKRLHGGADFRATCGGPVAIALSSPSGVRGAVNRAGWLNSRIKRSLYCTFYGTFGQCPNDTFYLGFDLVRWLIHVPSYLCKADHVTGGPWNVTPMP